jgi:hypothetical protein
MLIVVNYVGLGWVRGHIVEVGNLFCNWVEFSKELRFNSP